MNQDLQVGDVVKLKSGGPKMTIEKIAVFQMGGSKEEAKCVWFEGNSQRSHLFALEVLTTDLS